MTDRFWLGFACGALCFGLAVGWAQEIRMRVEERWLAERQLAGVFADQVVLAEALKLAVPDPLTRALIGAQGVRIAGEKAKGGK